MLPNELLDRNGKLESDATLNGFHHELEPSTRQGYRSGFEPNGMQDERVDAYYPQRETHESNYQSAYSAENGRGFNGMEVDEEPPFLPTLTEGHSIAIQSETVRDLGPSTVSFSISEKDSIMHAQWNPSSQKSILALGGVGLCQICYFREQTNPANVSRSDILQGHDFSMVTSMAFSPDARTLAVAIRADLADSTGTVMTFDEEGKALDDFTAGQEMIIKLRWNTNGNLLLGVASSGDGISSLIVWDMQSSQPYHLRCDRLIVDAAWSTENAITICGQGSIGRWDLALGVENIWWAKANPDVQDRDWSCIMKSPDDNSVYLFDEETAHVTSINPYGSIEPLQQIHTDSITNIASQPKLGPILVSSSLDGTVKVWHSKAMQLLSTYQFGQDSPPLAVALNPEGSLLAAANHNKVLVWSLGGSHIPVGLFKSEYGKSKGAPTNGHIADKDSGIGDDATEDGMGESNVLLDWHGDGRRLAFGVGNQVSYRQLLS